MADSVASPQSRPRGAASSKRRDASVSTDTEHKLARAARSAQRLAQLSAAPHDDSTLDMFPDDPTRATLEAMNIDIRQGTLHGFELPDAVLAAVGAQDSTGVDAEVPATDARTRRRSPAAGRGEEPVMGASFAGTRAGPNSTDSEPLFALETLEAGAHADAHREPQLAAYVNADAAPDLAQRGESAAAYESSTQAVERASGHSARPSDSAGEAPVAALSADADRAGTPNTTAATPTATAMPPAPELDLARATAFADTVDALYGVIADQRRAATDHTRRMKRISSIVVAALLVTVAIGIAQTLLLARLTRETGSQQQRIEQMMQSQQAAITQLIETRERANASNSVIASNASNGDLPTVSAPAATSTSPATRAPATSAAHPASHAAHPSVKAAAKPAANHAHPHHAKHAESK